MLLIFGGSPGGSQLPPARGGASPGRGELCPFEPGIPAPSSPEAGLDVGCRRPVAGIQVTTPKFF